MSRSFFADNPEVHVEVHVDDPGAGRAHIRIHAGETETWSATLRGAELGAAIDEVVAVVTAGAEHEADELMADPPGRVLPWGILWPHVAAARLLLVPLQRASMLAAAGSDRYERIHVDPDAPLEPLCERCRRGSEWDPIDHVAARTCVERGHSVFGGEGHPGEWEEARARHQRDLEWARFRQNMAATRTPLRTAP